MTWIYQMLCNYLVEEYYERIKPEINLVGSFLGDTEIVDILLMCRLKPYKYNTQFNRKLILRRHWVDEFGNSLLIENGKCRIVENHLEIESCEVKNSDLYFGLPISKIAKISKKMYLSTGVDEDFGEECIVLTFLGIDGCLRTFCLYNGQWKRYSALSLGIKNIKKIINNFDVKVFNKLIKGESVIYPCSTWEEWMVNLPINEIFWKENIMNKETLKQLGAF